MKARTFALLGVAVSLALALTAIAAAQGPGNGAVEHSFRQGGVENDEPPPRGPSFPPGAPHAPVIAPDGAFARTEPPPPIQPERGQRPLPPAVGLLAADEIEMLGVGPLGLGGGPFDVSYFFDGMESGAGSWTATGLWHIADAGSNYPNAYNGAASWWYGQEATGNYDTGAANSGTIQTGPIAIPADAAAAWLRFWSWEYTEDFGTQYDTRVVYTSTNGSDWTPIYTSTQSSAQWYEVLLDLSGHRGGSVYLRFKFDTVDGSYNGYRGWYIDDVAVGYDYVQLFPTSQTGYGLPGSTVWYPWDPPGTMWVQNNTGVTTAFTVTASGVWTATFPTAVGPINPGEWWWFNGDVQIPGSAGLGTYDDATLLVTSQVSPTLANTQTVRTWAGWVHHVGHQVIDDGSGNSQGDGDGQIDPGERVEMVLTLKNDLDRTAYAVNAWLWDSAWLLGWSDQWEPYGNVAAGVTANSLGRYEFHVPSWITPCSVITFYTWINARSGWWTDSFTETVACALRLQPDRSGAGDPGETVVYNLTLENWTGSAGSFDTAVSGNAWATTVEPDPTASILHGGSTPVTVSVTIPPTAQEGERDTATVHAAGVTNPAFSDTAVVTTSVLCRNRHVYTGSQSGTWYGSNYYYYGEPFARIYISATTNYTGNLEVSDGWSGTLLYSDYLSGTREVRLAYAPAVYSEIYVYIDDGWTGYGWTYDYRFETCYVPVQIYPQPAGAVAPPGNRVTGTLWVQNNTGVDTPFDLAVGGASWPTVVTPARTLTVTNGFSALFTVTVDIPGAANAGDLSAIALTATSVASPTLAASGRFTATAISTGWYQAYNEDYPTAPTTDNEAYLDSVNSFQQWQLTDDRDWQWGAAVSAFYRDRIPYTWARGRSNAYGFWIYEVEFGARDVTGAVVIPATRVADHSLAGDYIYDYDAAIAVDPVGGNVALAWTRYDRASESDPWRYNVWYAVYDEDGNVVRPPTALTSNSDNLIQDYSPAIEAYRDGHFAVVWEHYVYTGSINSIYYAVLNDDGSPVRPPSELTPNVGEWDDYDPRLAQLLDGNVMVLWEGELVHTGISEAAYAILSPTGSVVRGETALTNYAAAATGDPDAANLDGVDLDAGDVVVAWTNDDTGQIAYAILGADYTVVVSPTILTNTLSASNWNVSLVEDGDGRAVFTWRDRARIYYALVDPSGNVVVAPVVYRQARNTSIDVNRKGYGNGGMPARPLVKVYLPLVLRRYP